MIMGKWQEGGKGKEDTKSTSSEVKKWKSKRLEEIAKQERGGKKAKKTKEGER